MATTQPDPSSSTRTSSDSTASSTSSEPVAQISWPVGRPSQSTVWSPRLETEVREAACRRESTQSITPQIPLSDLYPGAKRSQAGISTRAFLLGVTLGISSLAAVLLLYRGDTRLWRPPFFLGTLALFHFLEFWTHAKYNVPNATTSTFLLLSNGLAYTLAHTTAMVETIITSLFLHGWQDKWASSPVQSIGLVLVIIGQSVRTGAMVTAGTNFHHHVQTKHNQGHVLVTNGIYAYLRHPSYFGFFYWAVGTQLVLGNLVSFWIYVLVLWRFFSVRIRAEEKHLVRFFGDDYVQYRARSGVGIPFIK